jgi:hypothetical protein
MGPPEEKRQLIMKKKACIQRAYKVAARTALTEIDDGDLGALVGYLKT